jgi:hypothetical protein
MVYYQIWLGKIQVTLGVCSRFAGRANYEQVANILIEDQFW